MRLTSFFDAYPPGTGANSTTRIRGVFVGEQAVRHLDMSGCCRFDVGLPSVADMLYSLLRVLYH